MAYGSGRSGPVVRRRRGRIGRRRARRPGVGRRWRWEGRGGRRRRVRRRRHDLVDVPAAGVAVVEVQGAALGVGLADAHCTGRQVCAVGGANVARRHRGPAGGRSRGPQGGVSRALATIRCKGAEAGGAVRARALELTRGAGGRGREGRRRRRGGRRRGRRGGRWFWRRRWRRWRRRRLGWRGWRRRQRRRRRRRWRRLGRRRR